MTTPTIALDLTRTLLVPLGAPTPRGIDRLEVAYAKHFLSAWRGDCYAIVPTIWGVKCYTRDRALRGVEGVEELCWNETGEIDDIALQATRHWLQHPTQTLAFSSRSQPSRKAINYFKLAARTGLLPDRATSDLPPGSIYINVGHVSLTSRLYLSWLEKRRDVSPVFMIHDTIPLDHPEFFGANEIRRYSKLMTATVRLAKAVIVPSEAARTTFNRHAQAYGRHDLPTTVQHLPVPEEFTKPRDDIDVDLQRSAYFVICGAIEPRKNHLLLINVWRELVREMGSAAPKLLIVGARHGGQSEAMTLLHGSETLSGYVVEVPDLSSPGLRRLLANARATLMPSRAEGFGLPIIESLALGTPVIASDLAAHREAGGTLPTYLSPSDVSGWRDAIRFHAMTPNRSAPLKTRSWDDYFDRIEDFLLQTASLQGGSFIPSKQV